MTARAGRADLDSTIQAKHVPAGEPVFLLRARDPLAAPAVRGWAMLAHEAGVPVAVVEQALIQADIMAAWSPQALPDADHLTDAGRKQLEYQHSRRAWRAGLEPSDRSYALAIELAERRGWDAAMAAVRNSILHPEAPAEPRP